MLRYNRIRFVVFGVLPIVNAASLLLFGLVLAANGRWGSEKMVPVLLGLVAVSLLATFAAAIKRGRDLGWKAAMTVVGLVLGAALGPLFLVALGYLAFARGNPGENEFGPPAPPAISALAWVWFAVAIAASWFIAVVGARVM